MNRKQKFDPSKGMYGNIEDALWGNQYRKNEIENNKAHTDSFELQVQADFVEAVIDEYNALMEG